MKPRGEFWDLSIWMQFSGAPSLFVGSIPLKVRASTAALNPVSPFFVLNL